VCIPPSFAPKTRLTGYTIATLLAQLAKQIVAAKAPQHYDQTNSKGIMASVEVKDGQFIVTFSPANPMPGGVDTYKQAYLDHAKKKGFLVEYETDRTSTDH
jgi:hypothetical protein